MKHTSVKQALIISSTLLALLMVSNAMADDGTRLDNRGDRIEQRLDNRGDRREEHLDNKGDRIEEHLDKKGDHIEDRLDDKADKARANGHDERAEHLENKGDKIDQHLDKKGERIDNRLGDLMDAPTEPYSLIPTRTNTPSPFKGEGEGKVTTRAAQIYTLCSAINVFNASFIRVCQPRPCALKYSNTSSSTRTDTATFVRSAFAPTGRPRIGLSAFNSASLNSKVSASNAMPALIAASSAAVGNVNARPDLDLINISFYLSHIGFTQANNAASQHLIGFIAVNKHDAIHTFSNRSIANHAWLTIIHATIGHSLQQVPFQLISHCQRNAMLGQVDSVFSCIVSNMHYLNVHTNKYIVKQLRAIDVERIKAIERKSQAANDEECRVVA